MFREISSLTFYKQNLSGDKMKREVIHLTNWLYIPQHFEVNFEKKKCKPHLKNKKKKPLYMFTFDHFLDYSLSSVNFKKK